MDNVQYLENQGYSSKRSPEYSQTIFFNEAPYNKIAFKTFKLQQLKVIITLIITVAILKI
jgi:hypothetical protein